MKFIKAAWTNETLNASEHAAQSSLTFRIAVFHCHNDVLDVIVPDPNTFVTSPCGAIGVYLQNFAVQLVPLITLFVTSYLYHGNRVTFESMSAAHFVAPARSARASPPLISSLLCGSHVEKHCTVSGPRSSWYQIRATAGGVLDFMSGLSHRAARRGRACACWRPWRHVTDQGRANAVLNRKPPELLYADAV